MTASSDSKTLAVTSMSSSMTENENSLLFSKNNNNANFSGKKKQQLAPARRVSSYKDFGIVTNNEGYNSGNNSNINSFIRFVPKQSSIDDPTSVQSSHLEPTLEYSANSTSCNNNLM